jgi:polar amino acid transport system permease protein
MEQNHQVGQHDIVAKPLKHPGRLIAAILLTVVLAAVVWSLVTNKNVNHEIIAKYLFDPMILQGALLTVWLTALSMTIATVLATTLAVMKLSENRLLRIIASGYIEFFRGTPLILQIVFWGYLGIIYPNITAGIPFTNIVFFDQPTSVVISSFTAGLIALSLNEAAYAAEIVRAGIMSVDPGQAEAAKSLGMSSWYTMRRIVLPQAMRVILPPMGNETISMLKSTSLLYAIAVTELYTTASQISSQNLAQIELLVVAAFWYLVMNTILGFPQRYLEKRFGRGFSPRSGALVRTGKTKSVKPGAENGK